MTLLVGGVTREAFFERSNLIVEQSLRSRKHLQQRRKPRNDRFHSGRILPRLWLRNEAEFKLHCQMESRSQADSKATDVKIDEDSSQDRDKGNTREIANTLKDLDALIRQLQPCARDGLPVGGEEAVGSSKRFCFGPASWGVVLSFHPHVDVSYAP